MERQKDRETEGLREKKYSPHIPLSTLHFFFKAFLLVFFAFSLWLCGSVANSLAPISPQADSQPQERQAQGGASTAGAFKPVKESSARPITAGGFVDGAPVYFADVTARAGLRKFRHVSGVANERWGFGVAASR
jgi:hypothetical protein